MTNNETDHGDWSESGYVVGTTYMRQFLRQQTPINVAFAAASNGHRVPDVTMPFRYCDLGCGEGVTLLLMAAAYPDSHFVGVDLNGDHIENAQQLAKRAGLTNIEFLQTDFATFADRPVENFDFIMCHGVLSWVSDDVVDSIMQLVDRHLAPGGLFYACYFTRPGASRVEILFHLFQDLLKEEPDGSLEQRALRVLDRLEELQENGAPVFKAFPLLKGHLVELRARDPRYLVHEYCNRYLIPRYFSEVVDRFERIGMSYAGSADLSRNETKNLLPGDLYEMVEDLSGTEKHIRTSLLAHDAFRWDVFRRPMDKASEAEVPNTKFFLDSAVYPYDYKPEATVWKRHVSFDTDAFRAIIGLGHSGTKTFEEVRADDGITLFDRDTVDQTLRDIIAVGYFRPLRAMAQSTTADPKTIYRLASPLSRELWDRDFLTEGITYLPSSIVGGALTSNGFSAMITRELDGKTIQAAIESAFERVKALEPEVRERLRLTPILDAKIRARAVQRFYESALPKLIKYGVIEKDIG